MWVEPARRESWHRKARIWAPGRDERERASGLRPSHTLAADSSSSMSASPSCAASAIVGGPTASPNERRAPRASAHWRCCGRARFLARARYGRSESRNESSLRGRAERWKVRHTNQSAHALRVALGREGAVSRDAGGDGASARTSSVVLGHLARLAAAVGEESPRARHRTPRVANARDAFGRGAEARLVGDRRG